MSPWVATTRFSLVATITPQPVPQNRHGALDHLSLASCPATMDDCARAGTLMPPAAAAAATGAREVAASAIQAHGGIGFTWEADVHWLFKRAQLDAALIGGGSRARIALARLVAGSR